MLSILGHPSRLCDRLERRELLRAGGLAAVGLGLPQCLRASERRAAVPDGPAKAIILVNLIGGPSHLDMFDMKPGAPPEIRGEFKPIDTSVPGAANNSPFDAP